MGKTYINRLLLVWSLISTLTNNWAQQKSAVENISSDSARITFLYPNTQNIKSVRLISDLVPYFDNGTRLSADNTGWLKKEGNNWSLTVTVDNRLRIPYRYEITADNNGKDSVYEVLDPSNPNTFRPDDVRIRQSMIVLAKAFDYPWEAAKDTSAKWKRIKINSGIQDDQKDIFVYTPPGYNSSAKITYPLLIALGSFTYGIEIPTALIYESLLKSGKVKPAVIVLVDYKSYNSLADFDSTARYITDEILPYMQKNYHASTLARDITLSGISRRGLVASYIALQNDKKIGNVISLSGGFSWRPNSKSEFVWFGNLLANHTKSNVNYYLTAGTLESVVTPNNAGHYILSVNRHIRNILIAKNYTFKYEELPGAHNTASWAHFLYNGMAYILGRKSN